VLFTVAAHDAQLAAVSVKPDEQLRERGRLPRLQGPQLDAGVLGPRVLLLQSGRGHGGQLGRAVDALRVAPQRIVAFLPPPRPRGLRHRHVLAMQLPGAQKRSTRWRGFLSERLSRQGVANFFHGPAAC
jgi:hypothetical protein